MPGLILLGTVHRDPQGLLRLMQALKGLHPDVITLEFSIYGLRYRLKKKSYLSHCLLRGLHELYGTDGPRLGTLKKIMRMTGIGGIRALLDLPFEYKATNFFSRRNGIPLYCVDISSFSRHLLGNIGELLEPGNLKKVITFETDLLREAIKREYKKAEGLLFNERRSPGRPLMPSDEVWEKRERIMANRIRKITTRYAGRQIVHIGGWQHLTAQPETLFSLLEDLMPKRVLLGSLYRQPLKHTAPGHHLRIS
jgi:hypothetical protein